MIVTNLENTVLMTREEDISRASRSLKAMSHPLRLKILCTLGDQEVSVQDIVESVGTSQSNISQHLAILRDKMVLRVKSDDRYEELLQRMMEKTIDPYEAARQLMEGLDSCSED